MNTFVVVGAGQAGGWAAKTLRDQKFAGQIILVGEEPHPPYERPPLSKDVLLGTRAPESTYLWTTTKLAELKIDLRMGCRAIRIDRKNNTITLSGGDTIAYDRLLITTGSRVRKLGTPGAYLQRIYYMRGINDAVAINQSLVAGSRLLVVGGGWIGLEVAAAARQRNVDVTLIEAANQLCARVLPAHVARYLQQQHQCRGVRILLNTTVRKFEGERQLECAELSNGEMIYAGAAVIGVGVVPNSEIAHNAGLHTDNGIVVDVSGRTSDASIFAAGDVANQPNGLGDRIRLESWSNAQNHAISTAKAMLGAEVTYNNIPYFWSDQYDIKLQMLGCFSHKCEVIRRGNDDSEGTWFFLEDNNIISVISVNRPQDIAVARRLIQKKISIDAPRLRYGDLHQILKART
jgi:3-phenylpropionate/trans-cinnamate dioxygenase ferredoxin reductase component